MNFTQVHPGQGLSLPQLVFALNEELKRTAYSPSYVAKHHQCLGERYADFCISFTFDQVSRLDQDASTALATIREWRNSFTPINRVPLDILSLIPTHLSSQRDRLCASFVCRHWRSTFLQRAELWSQLYLSKGEDYVKTLLERAKGSALDVTVGYRVPVDTMTLLSLHTKQFKRLCFARNQLADILRFSEVNSGPLPLLHTLEIVAAQGDSPEDSDAITHPSPLLFDNAPNMKVFRLHSDSVLWTPSFGPFVFPNLVSFDFSATPVVVFLASGLLDFLEGSPMLRTVDIKLTAYVSFEGTPRERVVVLPHVETFTLIVTNGRPGHRLAAHLSCPSARSVSVQHELETGGVVPGGIFPGSALWKTIIHQYTKNPIEEVTLETRITSTVTCKLAFRSADAAVVELHFKFTDEGEEEPVLPLEDIHQEVFAQATRTIRNHPQLASVKRLHIFHGYYSFNSAKVSNIAKEVGQLFKSVGPLDELTIHCCDLRPYFHSFFNLPECDVEKPIMFPPIKKLTISHPMISGEQSTNAIMGLAKSQHALGMPFERMAIRDRDIFAGTEERLRPWVGIVECCYDVPCAITDGWDQW
jgi:hypothetical protein